MADVAESLAYDEGPHGSVALRRRTTDEGDEVYELIVNGLFVMDTIETSTERLLASEALDRLANPADIVVGGLGLGFTVQALLADHRVDRIDVVEMDLAVVDWARAGLVPHTSGVLSDPRVHAHVADIRHFLPTCADATIDAILLDVDNGPDFLVHKANTEVYEKPFLSTCGRVLRPGGVLGVWSADPAEPLRLLLAELFGNCDEVKRTVPREGRHFDYYLYLATRH